MMSAAVSEPPRYGQRVAIARSYVGSGSAGFGRATVASKRGHAWALEAAGPILITAAVLVSMWRTVLGRIPNGDALTLWIPLWTYLGRSLHAGHLPLWQNNLMSGAPFAADAQSGWGYYEPMVLFTVLSPAHAMRAMLILQPLTAGHRTVVVSAQRRAAAVCGVLRRTGAGIGGDRILAGGSAPVFGIAGMDRG